MMPEMNTAISFEELKRLASQPIVDVDEDELPTLTDDGRGVSVVVTFFGGNKPYLVPWCREQDGTWSRCDDYITPVDVFDISTMDELESLMCDALDLVG